MSQTFKLAFRNIGRNKTRSLLPALAVAVGMSLLLLMAAPMEGEMRGAIQNSIRIQSGHLQIRPRSGRSRASFRLGRRKSTELSKSERPKKW